MSAPTNLVTIRPGVTFAADAAASFQRVEARAGRRVDVNSSYRDWDAQYKLWRDHVMGVPGAPLALHPDKSMHCKGLAFDTDDQAIMRTMGDYGWRQTALGVNEPWHFDYFRNLDKHFGEPADSGSGNVPTPTDEGIYETMFIANVKGGNFWLCEPGKKAHRLGAGSSARESGIPVINYPDDWALKQLQTSRPEITA